MSDQKDAVAVLVERINVLYAKATPGPWIAGGSEAHGYAWINTTSLHRGVLSGQYAAMVHDAQFVTELHNAWPQISAALTQPEDGQAGEK